MSVANRRYHGGFPDTIIYIEVYSGFKSFYSIQNYNQFMIIYHPHRRKVQFNMNNNITIRSIAHRFSIEP
jgi:hypothetical protein